MSRLERLLPREMKPVFRVLAEPPAPVVPMEQRVMEGWDNLMCAGKEFTLEEQSDQISQRLWESQLPREEDSE